MSEKKTEEVTPTTAELAIQAKAIKWDDLTEMQLTTKQQVHIRNFMLNQAPPTGWLKKHPVYNNSYLPIDKVEYLLTSLFGNWKVEVKEVKMIANSMQCTVRLYYWDSLINDFSWQDGVGAAPMQQDSGGGKLKANGVMLATPIAKTNAIKDAADTIGKLFGRDLNRKDTLNYDKEGEKFENLLNIEKDEKDN
jgi:hypothetical protein